MLFSVQCRIFAVVSGLGLFKFTHHQNAEYEVPAVHNGWYRVCGVLSVCTLSLDEVGGGVILEGRSPCEDQAHEHEVLSQQW